MKPVRWRGFSGYWPESKKEWITLAIILGVEAIILIWIVVYFVI